MAPVLNVNIIESSILPIVDRLVTDEIPNIRFNVAKSYTEIIKTLQRLPETGTIKDAEKTGTPLNGSSKGTKLIHDRVLPSLEKLQQDNDVDVRYFATTAAQLVTGDDEMES